MLQKVEGIAHGDGWRAWSKREWNDALVDAVFRNRPPGTIIRRIDTTQAWMARVVGASEDEAEQVRAVFLALFRGQSIPARALFDPARLTPSWTTADPHLPFFAELYLSLIVASADERTAELGRYRERLAELTGFGAGALLGHELPQLWRKAAEWSTTTAGDVAILVLPPAGSEAIIGTAKRLAFPSYLDQQRLAGLLARTGLDERAPIADLLAALDGELASFSQQFQSEYREFRERYQGEPADAARTPFWQALQEISWSRTGISAGAVAATLDLELDPSDPYDARITVIATGLVTPPANWTIVRDPSLPLDSVALVRDDSRAGPTLEVLQRDVVRGGTTAALQTRRMRLGLRAGTLAFVLQDLDRWTLAERLEAEDEAWLLLRIDVFDKMPEDLCTRTGHPVYRAVLPGSHAWKLVGPVAITAERLAVFVALLGATQLFAARMPSARLDLLGSVALPGGAYLRHPLLPVVRCDLASACYFRTLDPQDTILAEGTMVPFGEGKFIFPDSFLATGAARIRFDAHGEEGLLASRTIEAVHRCTADRSVPLSRPDHWLTDDDLGGLAALAQEARPCGPTGVAAPPPLWPSHGRAEPIQVAAMPPAYWSDITEMFAAIFARRQVLPMRRAIELLTIYHDGSPTAAWRMLELLVENGLVRMLAPRHWRGSALAAATPCGHIVEKSSLCRVRVVGALTELARLRLADAAASAGLEVAVHLGIDGGSLGATELVTSDIATARRIFGSAGIPTEIAIPPTPIPALRFRPLAEVDRTNWIESRWWDPARGLFGFERGAGEVALERRRFERRRDLYVMTTPDRMFVTESRRWALMAWAIAATGTVGEIQADGGIRLGHPALLLPPSVAHTTLVHGGGAVSRTSNGCLHYSSADTNVLIGQLAAWIRVAWWGMTAPELLNRALARHSGDRVTAIALTRYATSSTGTAIFPE